jgi:hypothetical protein
MAVPMKDDEELPPGVASNDAANLPPPVALQPPPPSGQQIGDVVLLKPVYRFLLAQARDLISAQQYQFAVILAHAACELATEETVNNLLRHWAEFSREAVMSDLKRGATLDDPKVLNLYSALAQDYPAGQPERGVAPAAWWQIWKVSLELRHEVAHNGLQVTKAQARGCVESCRHYIDHLAAMAERALPA